MIRLHVRPCFAVGGSASDFHVRYNRGELQTPGKEFYEAYEEFMPRYATFASNTANTCFYDPNANNGRAQPVLDYSDASSRQYRAGDNSHPNGAGGEIFAEDLAQIITAGGC